mgnify:CR=1 FL=1
MENNKTPSIRFKGFTDPWEQRKVSEIADRFDNLRVPVAANLRIPFAPYYGANGIQDYVEGYTHDGEYILVAEDGASDLKNYPVNYVNGRIWVNNHAHVLQGKEKIANNKFLSYAMSLSDIESVLVGGGRAKLNADIMMNLDVAIPSFNEQEKIGTYFSNLDNLITLHQRKYDKLQNIKKSMLEKMFPKNGSNVPEIRFSGFTDPWEQRKVLDLLELLTDYDANGSFADMAKNINTTDGDGYAWYVRITDLENPKPLSELKYVDESSYEFLKKTELHGGELLMAKRGNIGKVYIFEPRTKYATVAPNMYLLKLNNKVIPHFLYDYFVSEEGNKKLTRLNASSTMGALYKDDVKNIDVIMPSIEEQAMIGNFFQSIDHIITLHQRELEKLQNIKKSMLEKMFV